MSNYLSDGAVYYLNGAEVTRIRMPSGVISYATPAAATNSPVGHADILGIDGSDLQYGTNVFQVEVHQATNSSADMVFGLSLTAATHYPVTLVDTNQPSDQTVLAGQSATFTSDVLGSGPLSYQWFFNGTNPIVGANGPAYSIPTILTNNAGTYTLVVSNSFSVVTTPSALLTVSNTPVIITAEPANMIGVEGQPVTFSVTASGTPLLQYQWFYSSAAISGATNSSYTITSLAPTNSGSYYVSVSNPVGETNSTTATLTVLLDTIPPAITNISAGSTQVTITFSKPINPVTAGNAADYTINGGVSVLSAVQNPNDASQVTLTTTALNFNTVYALTVNGVDDLYGNAAFETADFARDITIDGSFDDWAGLAPVYSTTAPSGNIAPDGLGAADFKDIYVYNDANYYYFRVTLWSDINSSYGQFPDYVNMFFDTDNNPSTGYQPPIGSEMLVQSGLAYQEKDGNFNDGYGINGLNWLSLPATPGTNFEFQMSMAATFGEDGFPVFTTNAIQFLFQGMDPNFDVVNTVPASGGTISYTNVSPVSLAPLPLGKLAVDRLSGGNAAIVWYPPGTLQSCTNLTNPTWTNIPSATSPYVVPASVKSQFFRLTQ
jgi:Immunoglobulin domain